MLPPGAILNGFGTQVYLILSAAHKGELMAPVLHFGKARKRKVELRNRPTDLCITGVRGERYHQSVGKIIIW